MRIKKFKKIGIIFKSIVYNSNVQRIRDKKTDTKKFKKIGIIFKSIVYNSNVQRIRDKKTDTKKI